MHFAKRWSALVAQKMFLLVFILLVFLPIPIEMALTPHAALESLHRVQGEAARQTNISTQKDLGWLVFRNLTKN